MLYDYQQEAIEKLKPGNVLVGGVGSGKTITSLFYYRYHFAHKNLYVITTAKKRDSHDWEDEARAADIRYIRVDSWNNIKKYTFIKDAFFIFDEQKVVGYGTWAKSFIKIAKQNYWILLSATPGDVWIDYVAIFIANGFYKNKTDFINRHVEFDRFAKYPKIKAYHNVGELTKYRDAVVVTMDSEHKTTRHRRYIYSDYESDKYLTVVKNRWDPYEDAPIENASKLTQLARKVVATSEDRIKNVEEIISQYDRVICFYNYDYELYILEGICEALERQYAQWNGHKHETIPDTKQWVYICHYAAAEAWNCTETNVVLFYSPNYSYKVMEQAEGRIDRSNTKYVDLLYFYMVSKSSIDSAVLNAIRRKKKFNEEVWANGKRKSISKRTNKRN